MFKDKMTLKFVTLKFSVSCKRRQGVVFKFSFIYLFQSHNLASFISYSEKVRHFWKSI